MGGREEAKEGEQEGEKVVHNYCRATCSLLILAVLSTTWGCGRVTSTTVPGSCSGRTASTPECSRAGRGTAVQ